MLGSRVTCLLLAAVLLAFTSHGQQLTQYAHSAFKLTVRDDGKGFDEDTMQRQPSGHFGLPGMRERAEIAGGRLEVWSKLNSGTQVELSIPGAIAYDGASRTER